jgi:alpha-1,2-mannosyltransferase
VAPATRQRLLGVLGVALVLGSAVVAVVLGIGDRDFLDLGIYRDAVGTWWHGRSPYGVPYADDLQFNYPPSSLVLLTALSVLPRTATGILLVPVGASLLWLVLRWSLPSVTTPGIALIAGILAMSEPVQMTWRYGQVDLLVLAAVSAALIRARSRTDGPLLGAAAGLKLLPMTFLVVPALQRRWDTVVVACLTTAGLVVVAIARTPSMLGDYLDQVLHGAVVIRPGDEGHNVSWRGLLAWALGDGRSAALSWLLIAVALAVIGLVTVVRAVRTGDLVAGVSAVALLGLLLSPVTWTHHWVWVAVVLGTALPAWRSRRRVDRAHLVAVLALVTATVVWAPTWFANPDHSYARDGLHWLSAYSYVLLGTVVLATLALRVRTDAQRTNLDA